MPVADVRRARLAHFNQNSHVPISTVILLDLLVFLMEVVARTPRKNEPKNIFVKTKWKDFFLKKASIETKTEVEKETEEIDIVSFINKAKHDFQMHTNKEKCKHTNIQRDLEWFWHVLLKQTFIEANKVFYFVLQEKMQLILVGH